MLSESSTNFIFSVTSIEFSSKAKSKLEVKSTEDDDDVFSDDDEEEEEKEVEELSWVVAKSIFWVDVIDPILDLCSGFNDVITSCADDTDSCVELKEPCDDIRVSCSTLCVDVTSFGGDV